MGAGALARSITSLVGGAGNEVWFASAITICTVVLCPPVGQAADYWGRKWLLVGLTLCGGIGAIVVSRATSIGAAIAGFTITGLSYGAQAILYTVVSEVIARKYRSWAQASIQVSGSAGGIVGLLCGGALTRHDVPGNVRVYFYISAGIYFGASAACAICYNPPKRELQNLPLREKLRRLDWIGYALLTVGLVLFCIGLSWSQNPFPWTDAHVLAPFIIGLVGAIALVVYEFFKGDGMFHRALFRDRNFSIALFTLFVEGLVYFSVNNYFAFEVSVLLTTDPLMVGLHTSMVFYGLLASALVAGVYLTKRKAVRFPSVAAFVFFVVFYIAMATIDTSTPERNIWAYPILMGLGLGVCITVLVTAAQFATPAELIASSSSLATSGRNLGGTIGLAIYNAILNHSISANVGEKMAAATIPLGLPSSSLEELIPAMLQNDQAALAQVPGADAEILAAAGGALKETYVIGFRNIWIAAGAFSVVALIGRPTTPFLFLEWSRNTDSRVSSATFFLRDSKEDFNSHVDAPIVVEPNGAAVLQNGEGA